VAAKDAIRVAVPQTPGTSQKIIIIKQTLLHGYY
jgi:hypothetical protein